VLYEAHWTASNAMACRSAAGQGERERSNNPQVQRRQPAILCNSSWSGRTRRDASIGRKADWHALEPASTTETRCSTVHASGKRRLHWVIAPNELTIYNETSHCQADTCEVSIDEINRAVNQEANPLFVGE
jgi:hypothetical protein